MKIRFAIDDTLNTHHPITPAPSTSSLTTATFQNFRESAPGVEERAVEFRERPLIIVSRCRVGIFIPTTGRNSKKILRNTYLTTENGCASVLNT